MAQTKGLKVSDDLELPLLDGGALRARTTPAGKTLVLPPQPGQFCTNTREQMAGQRSHNRPSLEPDVFLLPSWILPRPAPRN